MASLLEALLKAQQRPAETNYGIATQGVAAMLPALNNPYDSPARNAGYTVGGALLAGILSGLARQSAAEENIALTQGFNQLLTADDAGAAELVQQNERLSPLWAALVADRRERAQDLAQKRQELTLGEESDLRKSQNKAVLDAMISQGKIPMGDKIVGFDALGLKSPDEYAIDKEVNQRHEMERLESESLGVPAKVRDEEIAARKDISELPAVKQLKLMETKLPMLESDARLNTRSSDVAFFYNFIRALDDGAVRGEEIDLAGSSNPVLQKYGAQLLSAFNGQSQLTPTLKLQMLSELKATRGNLAKAALEQSEFKIAQIQKIIPKARREALLPFDFSKYQEEMTVPAVAPLQIRAPDGQLIELVD